VIVVDTNLLVDAYVPRARTPLVEAVLARDPQWAAPLLWRSEFRNVLLRLIADGLLHLADALRIADEAERRMRGGEHQVVSTTVLRLAAASGCTAYDCEFVAVAQETASRLVTSDAQVLKAFRGLAITPERFARQ
jgi:predicted nucleic acid-binding protein